jgi:hypothetical protein
MSNGNGTSKTARRPNAEEQAKAYRSAVEVILEQSDYLLKRVSKKVKSADWDEAQSASRALTGYATDLNRAGERQSGMMEWTPGTSQPPSTDDAPAYQGTLIEDLMRSVEQAERNAKSGEPRLANETVCNE